MSQREQFMYDVRVRDRFLNEGAISKTDVEKHLAGLVDLADACEELELEQPALASEQEEVAAPVEAPPVVAPGPSPTLGGFGAEPARAPIPAIAEPAHQVPAAAEPSTPAEPVPAIANETQSPGPAPAVDPHGPASVPPPTASVDADWGDS